MIIQLDEEINQLRKTLLEMGNSVEEAIEDAVKALKERDDTLAKQVIKNDLFINRLEVKIDKICLRIFALKQPIAIDLRFVASGLKINNDLERMGDFAARIANNALGLSRIDDPPYLDEIYTMKNLVQQMLKLSLEAFIQKNVEMAKKMIEQDKEVDKHYEKVIEAIGPYVNEDSERFETGLMIIDTAKCLERIGDHAKNICEDAIYLAKGEIVKHQPIN
ncbi:MAG: phosphate transport system regulatory protein PhoU [bacterium]|nr:MAG: phosphate transport system regulatory protein PhoU [bacterium]